MKSEICKDRTCTGKEGENPRTIFDLQHEPSEQADDPEEEEDPLTEEDAREDRQARQEADHLVALPGAFFHQGVLLLLQVVCPFRRFELEVENRLGALPLLVRTDSVLADFGLRLQ